jgi:hypothetical protein
MVRIYWRNEQTGATGHGSLIDRHSAEGWIKILRRQYPSLIHWIA